MNLKYRHEWKHEINLSDLITIRQRLSVVASTDIHAINGTYRIRSLYFDDFDDTALREKIAGVSRREKFRIRYYNDDLSFINLEKKSKIAGLCNKQSAVLTAQEAQAIVGGDIDWMIDSDRPLVRELYCNMRNGTLRPKTIVDYTREAFVYAPGNARITLDYDIRTGIYCTDFLNPDCVTVTPGDAPIILEVKWDEFLTDIIRDAVGLENRRVGAFSKYAACRIYG